MLASPKIWKLVKQVTVFSFWKSRDKKAASLHVAPTTTIITKSTAAAPTDWNKVREQILQRILQEEADFDAYIEREFGGQTDKSFYAKVAGASHRNDDGTSRRVVIEGCKSKDLLSLRRDPDNPYDPNAIKICTAFGEQLGFVESRLAGEIVRDCAQYGLRYFFIFCRANHHPETDRVVGATIYVARLKKELADSPPGIFEPEVSP